MLSKGLASRLLRRALHAAIQLVVDKATAKKLKLGKKATVIGS